MWIKNGKVAWAQTAEMRAGLMASPPSAIIVA
jgi:hypothetical protein